jgi:hypothetical protein
LLWQLKLGDKITQLQKLQDRGREVPLLDNRPELTIEASHYLGIFQDLNSCRIRDGSTPISAQDIYYYCELNDITGVTLRSEIFDMIKFADNLFLTFNEKAKK